jgi:hypothetical protein
MRYYNYNCMSEQSPATPKYDAEKLTELSRGLDNDQKKRLRKQAKKLYIEYELNTANTEELKEQLIQLQSEAKGVVTTYENEASEELIQTYFVCLEIGQMITDRIDEIEKKPTQTTQPTTNTSTPPRPDPRHYGTSVKREGKSTQSYPPQPLSYSLTGDHYRNTNLREALIRAKSTDTSEQLRQPAETHTRLAELSNLTELEVANQQERARKEVTTIIQKFELDLSLFDLLTKYENIKDSIKTSEKEYLATKKQTRPNDSTTAVQLAKIETEFAYLHEAHDQLRSYTEQWKLPTFSDSTLPTNRKQELKDWKVNLIRDLREAKTASELKSVIGSTQATLAIDIAEYPEHSRTELTHIIKENLTEQFKPNKRKHYTHLSEQLKEYQESEYERIMHEQLPILGAECIQQTIVQPDTARITPEVTAKTESVYEQSYTPAPLSIKPRILASELARVEALVTDTDPFGTFNTELRTHWNDPSWDIDSAYETAEQGYCNQQYLVSLRIALGKLREVVQKSVEIPRTRKDELIAAERARRAEYTEQVQPHRAQVHLHQFYRDNCVLDNTTESLSTIDVGEEFDILTSPNSLPIQTDIASKLLETKTAKEHQLQSQERTKLLQEQSDIFKTKMKIDGTSYEHERLLNTDYTYYIKGDTIKNLEKKKPQEILKELTSASDNKFNITKLAFDTQFIADYGQDPEVIKARFERVHAELARFFTPPNRPLTEDLDAAISAKLGEIQTLTIQYHRCAKYYKYIQEERIKLASATGPDLDSYRTEHEKYATSSKWKHDILDATGAIVRTVEYRNAANAQELIATETETLWKNHWKTSSIADLHIELANRTNTLNALRTTRDTRYTEFLHAFGRNQPNQFDALSEWKQSQQDFTVAELHTKELQKYLKAFPLPNTHQCAPDSNGAMKCIDTRTPISPSLITLYQQNPATPPALQTTIQWIEHTLSDSSGWPFGGLDIEKVNLKSYTGKHGVLESLDKLKKKLEVEITPFRKSQNASSMTMLGHNSDASSPYQGFYTLALAYLEKKKTALQAEFRSKYIIEDLPTNELRPEQAQKQKISYEKHITSECGKISESIYTISSNTYDTDRRKAEKIQDLLISTFMHTNEGAGDFSVRTDQHGKPRKDLVIGGEVHMGELARRAIVRFAVDAMRSEPAHSLLQAHGLAITNAPTINPSDPYLSSAELSDIALKLNRDKDPNLATTNPNQARSQQERDRALFDQVQAKIKTLNEKRILARGHYEGYPGTQHFAQECYNIAANLIVSAQNSDGKPDTIIGSYYITEPGASMVVPGDTLSYTTPHKPKQTFVTMSDLLKNLSALEEQLNYLIPSGNLTKPNYGDLFELTATRTRNGTPMIEPAIRAQVFDSPLFARARHIIDGVSHVVLQNIKQIQPQINETVRSIQDLKKNKLGELRAIEKAYRTSPWFKQLELDSLITDDPYDPSTSARVLSCALLKSHQSMTRSLGITARKFVKGLFG